MIRVTGYNGVFITTVNDHLLFVLLGIVLAAYIVGIFLLIKKQLDTRRKYLSTLDDKNFRKWVETFKRY